jgi:hypothetical protein
MTAFEFDERLIEDQEYGGGGPGPDEQQPTLPLSLDPEAQPASDEFGPEPGNGNSAEPDASLLGSGRRVRNSRAYENKLRNLFSVLVKETAKRESTVADSAALLMYGPDAARALGDLAAKDARVARGIDMITDGAENPYATALLSVLPLAAQVLRNHEPTIEPRIRTFRVPGVRREFKLPLKFGVRVEAFRSLTFEPESLTRHVFGDGRVQEAFRKQGLRFAWNPGSRR